MKTVKKQEVRFTGNRGYAVLHTRAAENFQVFKAQTPFDFLDQKESACQNMLLRPRMDLGDGRNYELISPYSVF